MISIDRHAVTVIDSTFDNGLWNFDLFYLLHFVDVKSNVLDTMNDPIKISLLSSQFVSISESLNSFVIKHTAIS